MNVRQIVIAHLKSIGADGLANGICNCRLDGGRMNCINTSCEPVKFDPNGFYRPIDTPNDNRRRTYEH